MARASGSRWSATKCPKRNEQRSRSNTKKSTQSVLRSPRQSIRSNGEVRNDWYTGKRSLQGHPGMHEVMDKHGNSAKEKVPYDPQFQITRSMKSTVTSPFRLYRLTKVPQPIDSHRAPTQKQLNLRLVALRNSFNSNVPHKAISEPCAPWSETLP